MGKLKQLIPLQLNTHLNTHLNTQIILYDPLCSINCLRLRLPIFINHALGRLLQTCGAPPRAQSADGCAGRPPRHLSEAGLVKTCEDTHSIRITWICMDLHGDIWRWDVCKQSNLCREQTRPSISSGTC